MKQVSATGWRARQHRSGERGVSLIAVCFLVVVTGAFIAVGARMYSVWESYRVNAHTHEKIAYIQSAMQQYYTLNGRYPCPAPLTAAIDVDGFGREVATDCTQGALAGTFRAGGTDGRMVRTGAVPVRTLNIADKYGFDRNGQRLIYAVTEQYAVQDTPVAGDAGAITVIDAAGNNATAVPGNVIQVVYSMGDDTNGAYSTNGLNIRPCDTTVIAGENCDFDSNATFLNTLSKSTNEASLFVHNISYVPHRHPLSCEDVNSGIKRAKNTSFLVDTSGSMGWAGTGSDGFNVQCPYTMPGCSRVDVARWALRRTIPAHIHNKNSDEEQTPGMTALTGFVATNTVNNVESNLGNITFDDPSVTGYVPPEEEDVLANLETELQAMCPSGGTPLGIHMMALAERLRVQMRADIAAGGDPEQFSKIIVFSDGVSNNGMSPIAAANQIAAMRNENPPINIQIDIIDVVGNDTSLRQIAQNTGGSYYNTGNPDELLNALYAATGVCSSYTPTPPVDQPGCGSEGDWWENN